MNSVVHNYEMNMINWKTCMVKMLLSTTIFLTGRRCSRRHGRFSPHTRRIKRLQRRRSVKNCGQQPKMDIYVTFWFVAMISSSLRIVSFFGPCLTIKSCLLVCYLKVWNQDIAIISLELQEMGSKRLEIESSKKTAFIWRASKRFLHHHSRQNLSYVGFYITYIWGDYP